MYSFRNDYNEGCHPKVLEALIKTNDIQTVGYSEDEYTDKAKALIKEKTQRDDIDIHCVVGGTQANMICVTTFLRPHQAVISANTGHVNVHESGAIEGTGHKVVTIPTTNGKITPEQVDEVVKGHPDEHMVQPKMIYISNPTEIGTIYSASELEALYTYAKQHNLYLYVDGARLASALAIKENSMTMADLAKYSDAFYIGGTKCGAMFGEAIVISNPDLKEDFRYIMKQRGGMLAKGRLLGVQFAVLMEGDLYIQIGEHENEMAHKMKDALIECGCTFDGDSPTNQLFPNINKKVLAKLDKDFDYTWMYDKDEDTCNIRLVTSYATKEEEVDHFCKCVKEYYAAIQE